MQLRQTKSFGVFDHHDCRFRHIDANFNDRRRDKDLRVAALERLHGGVLFGALHAAMNQPDPVAKVMSQIDGACPNKDALGVLKLGNESLEPEPTVAHLTDWFCPEAGVVMRQEVEQHGQTQVIDVVDLTR